MALRLITDGESPFDLTPVADEAYRELNQTDELSIELNFVSKEEIRKLNKDFRGKERIIKIRS